MYHIRHQGPPILLRELTPITTPLRPSCASGLRDWSLNGRQLLAALQQRVSLSVSLLLRRASLRLAVTQPGAGGSVAGVQASAVGAGAVC